MHEDRRDGERALSPQELARLSTTFIGLPAEALDGHIEEAIGRVADAFDLDRAMVGEEAADGHLRVTHQWARAGHHPLDMLALDAFVPLEQAPWIAARIVRGEPVIVGRPEDLPPEAWRDQTLMRGLGARSAAIVPLAVAGEVLGWVAFVAARQERAWPPAVVETLRLAANMVANALGRKRASAALARALEFERVVGDVSAAFVGVQPEALDRQIVDALGRMGTFLGVDRASVVQHIPSEHAVVRTHQWLREGVSATPASAPEAAFPWLVSHVFGAQQLVAVPDLDALPPEAARDREGFAQLGVLSGAAVPMVVDGRVVGVLAFGSVSGARPWPPTLTARLRLTAEVMGSALARARAERDLRAALADNERLRERLAAEKVYFQQEAQEVQHFGEVVGQSAALQDTLARVDQVAPTDVPVLLLGETGTGKELLARAIHARSRRRQRALIAVNCAALPPTLIESELFGYERGAFTGATQAKPGRFELADGGTLFLDEIGDLEPALQATLLRVLQDGEIQRLGSTASRRVDVRIIAATNRDLRQAMRDDKFRDDLWYRLSVFPIDVPPLRERRADIPLLVWHVVRSRQRALGRTITAVPQAAMEALTAYDWPGNIRELYNVVERAMIISPGTELRAEEALGLIAGPARGGDATPDGLEEAERGHIARILRESGWRVEGPGQAAERLGLKPSTLRNRMRKLGIRRPAS